MNKVQQVFDSWAGTERGERMAAGHDVLVNHILGLWVGSDIEHLLDAGCGNGRALMKARERGAQKLAGIDISETMIAEAKKNVTVTDLHSGSMSDMYWWNDDIYSHIMSIEALYYLPDPLAGLKELRRVLKESGKIAIAIDYYKENLGTHTWHDAIELDLKLLSSAEWLKIFQQAGFEDVKASRIRRKHDMQPEAEFVPSPYFPNYEMYKVYKEEGALLLAN